MDQNNYMKQRWVKRRLEAIAYLGGQCSNCGTFENLEFHHKDPQNKLFTIARGSSFSNKRFYEEINKCVLLCFDCHKSNHKTKEHGLSMYRYCKCQICKGAKAAWQKQYKQNHPR